MSSFCSSPKHSVMRNTDISTSSFDRQPAGNCAFSESLCKISQLSQLYREITCGRKSTCLPPCLSTTPSIPFKISSAEFMRLHSPGKDNSIAISGNSSTDGGGIDGSAHAAFTTFRAILLPSGSTPASEPMQPRNEPPSKMDTKHPCFSRKRAISGSAGSSLQDIYASRTPRTNFNTARRSLSENLSTALPAAAYFPLSGGTIHIRH